MRSCAVCYFFRPEHPSDDEGACYVLPPVPFLTHDAMGEAVFTSVRPTVERQEYCRAFSHRVGPKPETRGNDSGPPELEA